MPLRDLECRKCSIEFIDVICRVDETHVCPECGDDLHRRFTPATMIGPTERHPRDLTKAAGMMFTSVAAERNYFKRTPHAELVSKSDSAYQRMYNRVRAENERVAKAQGFRDWDHRQHASPKEKQEWRAANQAREASATKAAKQAGGVE